MSLNLHKCPYFSILDNYWGRLPPELRAGFNRPARRRLDKCFQTLLSAYLHTVSPAPRLVCEASWANLSNSDCEVPRLACKASFIYSFSKQAFPVSENRSLKAQLPLIPLFALQNCPLLLLLLLLPVSLFTGLSHICLLSDFIVGGSREAVVEYPGRSVKQGVCNNGS